MEEMEQLGADWFANWWTVVRIPSAASFERYDNKVRWMLGWKICSKLLQFYFLVHSAMKEARSTNSDPNCSENGNLKIWKSGVGDTFIWTFYRFKGMSTHVIITGFILPNLSRFLWNFCFFSFTPQKIKFKNFKAIYNNVTF